MNVQRMIGTAFLVCGLCYAFFMGRDIIRNKEYMKKQAGSLPVLMGLEFAVYFVCTLGVSDFLLNTLAVRKLKLADDKSLPSCLIASTIVPGAFIAFSFLKAENSVSALTLVLWMLFLALGGIFGAKAVDRMDGALIKKIMGIALIFSLCALIVKMIVTAGAGGTLTGLSGARLLIMCVMCVIIGFINMLGVPTKPAATALLLLLGMSPLSTLTLTLVLGCITPMSGGTSIVKSARYNRKLVLSAMTAGSAAAILGCILAVSLNAMVLNILLIVVMLIAIISIFRQ